MKKNSAILVLATGVLLAASPAMAIPVAWTMSGVTFNDGGTASGSFTYDADTDVFSPWAIDIVGGSVAALPTFSYNPSTSKDTGCVGSQICFDTIIAGVGEGSLIRQIGFVPIGALTNAGGTLGISLAFEQECRILSISSLTSYSESCNPANSRSATSGTLTAATTGGPGTGGTAVPEPASIALFGAGLLGFLGARRRRRS